MAEDALVSLFGVLLVLGAVLLLFAPLFYRFLRRGLWAFSLLILVPAFLVASAGTTWVEQSFQNPLFLAPIVAFVFLARVVSPVATFFRVREQLSIRGIFGPAKPLAFIGFLAMGLYVGLRAFSPVSAEGDPVIVTERLLVALGTAFLLVRLYWKVMPRGSPGWLMVWAGAILYSLAFAVVAPYAFPEYQALYGLSGIMGWLIGAAIIWKTPAAPGPVPWGYAIRS